MHKALRSLLSAVAAGTAALVAAPAVADEAAPAAVGYFLPVTYILAPASGGKTATLAFKPCSQVDLGRLSTDPAHPSVAFCSAVDLKPVKPGKPGKPSRAAAKPATLKPVAAKPRVVAKPKVVMTPVGYIVPSYILQMPTLMKSVN